MAKVSPFHSTRKDDDKVHHDNNSCVDGNNIEDRYRASGTGGHPKCKRCANL